MVDPINKQLHFIIGIGRSGTTILNKILNSHPAIHCMPEANFFLFFLHDYKNVSKFSKSDIELVFQQIKIFSLSHPLVGWDFDMEKTKNELIALVEKENISYQHLCKIIYSAIKVSGKDKSDAIMLIDKNPAFTLSVDKIANYLPEAKFILCVRDYRANVLSRKQNAYLKSPKVAYNAIRWRVFNVIANRFYQKNKDKVLLLRYEDLVSDYNTTLKKIFTFLNVSEKDLIEQVNTDKIDISDVTVSDEHKKYFAKKYADLNRPINTSRVNAWQTELSPYEIAECEAICGNFANVYGYKEFKSVSFLKKFGIILKNIFVIAISYLDIKKDQVLFHVPAKIKMKQLINRHKDLGFMKK